MILKKMIKKVTFLLVGTALVSGFVPAIPVNAAQTVEEYVLFAGEDGESIYVDAGHINMNGDIVTNGKFVTTLESPGINGTIYENQNNDMPDYSVSIQNQYYTGDVYLVEGDYSPQDFNENISKAMQVEGAFVSAGNNIAINGGALMTMGDVTIDGGSFSCSDGVIYSKEGNIHIATDNFSASALFYAPNGTVYIECGNINMNGCVAARSIEIVSSGGVNLNKNQELIRKFGQVIEADGALNDTEDNNWVESRETELPEGGSAEQQGDSSEQPGKEGSSEQNLLPVPLPVDDSGHRSVGNEGDVLQFTNVSKQELKNPIDLFILIYQILTGQKGVVIYDIG